MKTSKLLAAAKDHLWDGLNGYPHSKARFICVALDRTYWRPVDHNVKEAVDRAYAYIRKALRGYDTVEGWLERYVPDSPPYLHDPAVIQACRHRWLDHIINEFQSKGD